MRNTNNLSPFPKFRNCLRLFFLYYCFGTSLAVFAFCAYATAQTPETTGDEEKIRVRTGLVAMNVTVADPEGRAIAGLAKDDFTLLVDGKPCEIDFFGAGNSPASVVIVFDTSGSMSDEKIKTAKTALARFIETSSERDEFFLVNFGSQPVLRLDRGIDQTDALKLLTNVRPNGNTAFYDAVGLGLERAAKGRYAKKILLVISDGEDNYSRISYRSLHSKIQESEAIVYAIGFESGVPFSRTGMSGSDKLKQMTGVSGGRAFFPKGIVEMDETFERIALEIRNVYTVGFYTTDTEKSGKRRLKVKVKLPANIKRAIVRSREFYTPPDGNVK